MLKKIKKLIDDFYKDITTSNYETLSVDDVFDLFTSKYHKVRYSGIGHCGWFIIRDPYGNLIKEINVEQNYLGSGEKVTIRKDLLDQIQIIASQPKPYFDKFKQKEIDNWFKIEEIKFHSNGIGLKINGENRTMNIDIICKHNINVLDSIKENYRVKIVDNKNLVLITHNSEEKEFEYILRELKL